MAKAAPRDIPAARELEAHYAMTEQQKYKLHLVSRALDGLVTLTCPGEIEEARCAADATREDLAAIFELIRIQIDVAVGELPFVPAITLPVAANDNHSEADDAVAAWSYEFGCPTILFGANRHKLYGRRDLVKFVSNLQVSQIPWRKRAA